MLAGALLFAVSAAAPVSHVTSLGRDLNVDRPVSGRVVSVLGNVRIAAPVSGDVIVWGGSVSFGETGEVLGNLSVFGGDVRSRGGPLPVRGTVSTPGSLLRLYLEELSRAPWEAPPHPMVLAGLRLVALAGWLAVSLLLLYTLGSPFARAAASAEGDLSGTLLAGALGVLTLFLAAAAALALLPAFVAIPVALALALCAVAAKVFGMAVLFLFLGQKVIRSVAPARRPAALAAGFAILGAVSLLPLVGGVVWAAASILAVGIAVLSRFGTPRLRVAIT
ncbi:MAG TPA: hypothetical protein VKJ00_01520 [Thermoanaerobaculia bacterium]|nr:hypothetical protein [Thermoanaerobaculia bacterium]